MRHTLIYTSQEKVGNLIIRQKKHTEPPPVVNDEYNVIGVASLALHVLCQMCMPTELMLPLSQCTVPGGATVSVVVTPTFVEQVWYICDDGRVSLYRASDMMAVTCGIEPHRMICVSYTCNYA